MSASRRSVFSWKSRLVFAVGALVLGASGARGANPLPGVTIQNVKPVVVLLMDYSGSMDDDCDAAPVGGLVPISDLRENASIPAPLAGHFLYDPRENEDDDGANCDDSRGTVWTDSTDGFDIQRIEALKLAVSNILDATGDGVIDSADELVLDVHLGIASYSGDLTTSGYKINIEAPVGTDFATAWANIKDDTVDGGTPTGSALAGARALMMEPCWDNSTGTACTLPAAELEPTYENDASLSCRNYYVILITDGQPNGDYGGVNEDPVRAAYALKNKLRVPGEAAVSWTPNEVKTISIGIGADVDDLDSDARGSINCPTYFSGADANYDGDNNPLTMQSGLSFPNFQSSENLDNSNSSPSTMSVQLPAHATGDILVAMVNVKDGDDVITFGAGGGGGGGTCDAGWSLYGSSCYYEYTSGDTRANAIAAAAGMGAQLVKIDDAAENAWIVSTFNATTHWIGLNDIGTEGVYQWQDGTPLGAYTNWTSGQPNGTGIPSEDAVFKQPGGTWNDINATSTYAAIFEKPAGGGGGGAGVGWTLLTSTPMSPTTPTIPRGTAAQYWVYWKRAGAGTEPNPTVTRVLVGTNGGNMTTSAVSFRGAKSSGDPWGVIGTPSTGTGDRGAVAGVTTTTSNSLVVAFLMNNGDKRTDKFLSSLATWSEQYDQEDKDGGHEYGMHVWTALKSTPGSIGDITSECTSETNAACVKFSGSNGWGGILAALTSASGSGGPTVVASSCNTSASGSGGFDDDAYGGSACVGAADFVCGVGNGYFAQNADAIQDAVEDAFAFATTGSFSGSQPTVSFNVGGLSVGNVVYATFFDVVPNQFLWRGHLRKYRYNASLPTPDYVDCDNPAVAVSLPEACWDAAGWHAGSLYQVVNTAGFTVREETGSISYHGLAERHWSTRRIFTVNPQNLVYNRDTTVEQSTRPANEPDGTLVKRSIKGLVAALMAGTGVPYPPSSGDVSQDTSGDLLRWVAMANMASATETYQLTDSSATIGSDNVTEALKAFMFAAGRPTSRYADDITQRCPIGPNCTDSVPTMKLMDSYHSRPVLVGPPAGVSTDPSYIGTFFEQTLAPTSYSASPYREDVVEYSVNLYVTTSSGSPGVASIADPCDGVTPCQVKSRRKVIYTGGNDGMMHAFDEKSGHELWAFIPPSNLRRLNEMRADRSVYVDGAFSVRDVKMRNSTQNFADGNWHTILVSSQGLGGNFYFAMDVTNPVDPVFLWEYRKPDNLGNTVPRAVIGEIPAPTTGTTDANPGSVVFAAGGTIPTSGINHFLTLQVNTGLRLASAPTVPSDLPLLSTSPAGVPNSMIGEPRPVDANLDGKIDRVYFGDAEGRLWKACNIGVDGTFTLQMFFDPATYDVTGAPGQPIAGNIADPTNLVGTTTPSAPGGGSSADRKTLRGPIYFPADVTHDGSGKLIVAFGSGNVFDPLTAPAGYNNFIWLAADNESGGAGSCGPPLASQCSGSTAANSFTAEGGSVFNDVLPVDKLLTGQPLILNNYLIYPEFERLGTVSSCTGSAFESRVVARDLSCGIPGVLPFTDSAGNPTNVITYQNTLVTGLQVDPRSGTLFAQTSTGSGPPAATNVSALQARLDILGFRLQY